MASLVHRKRRRTFAIVVASVIAGGVAVLAVVSLTFPGQLDPWRLLFWVALTLAASWLPVKLPGDIQAHANTAPLIAAMFDPGLANPIGTVWVALLGTFTRRELRGQVVWYGVLHNHMNFALSTYGGWAAMSVGGLAVGSNDLGTVAQIGLAGVGFAATNVSIVLATVSARMGVPVRRLWVESIRTTGVGFLSQVPIGWLMAQIASQVSIWATILFFAPLFITRYSFTKVIEHRNLFFGSVSALSQAIDAKDGYTRGHADRVSRIAGAVARELGLSEDEIQRVELAAVLHDMGKIGVEDQILLKPARLDEDEKEVMQRHPIYSAAILGPVEQLAPILPIVRHHHEHWDGSGYPDGLRGEQIPLGSRIILVSDAYEAMTSDRVYRPAIGHERALEQLRTYTRVQFDPNVVAAFERVIEHHGVHALEVSELPPITYETLEQVRRRLARERESEHLHVG